MNFWKFYAVSEKLHCFGHYSVCFWPAFSGLYLYCASVCHCMALGFEFNSQWHCSCIIYLAVYFAVVNCKRYKLLSQQQQLQQRHKQEQQEWVSQLKQ